MSNYQWPLKLDAQLRSGPYHEFRVNVTDNFLKNFLTQPPRIVRRLQQEFSKITKINVIKYFLKLNETSYILPDTFLPNIG